MSSESYGRDDISRRKFLRMSTAGAVVAVAAAVGGYVVYQSSQPQPYTSPRPQTTQPPAAPAAPAVTSPTTQAPASPSPAAPSVEVTKPEVVATPQATAPQLGAPIVLGMANAETGLFARDGIAAIHAEQQAFEEWEAIWGGLLGGRKWRLVNVDAPNKNTEEASAAIRRLVTLENVNLIVTDYITVDASEYSEAAQHEIFFINHDTSGLAEQQVLASGWRAFNAKGGGPDTIPAWPNYKMWNTFEGVPYDTDYSKNLVMHLNTWFQGKGDQGGWKPINKKYAIIEVAGAYAQRIAHSFNILMQTQGWKPTVRELIPYGTVEYTPILEKIRADPPALIFNTDFIARDHAAFMNQFREDPTPSIVFGQYAPAVPEFLELAKENGVGELWHECRGVIHDPHGLDYIERLWARWNEPPALANSAQQYDMARVSLMLGHFTQQFPEPWKKDGGRRVSAILNSGVNFFISDFMTREIGGPWAMRPGQTNRPWPMENIPNDDTMSLGGPIVTYQIKLRANPHGRGFSKDVGKPGDKPTHSLLNAGRATSWFHEKKDLSIRENLAPDVSKGEFSNISRAIMEADPKLYHMSGTYPFDADGVKPKWADGVFEVPAYFKDVRPEILARVSQ